MDFPDIDSLQDFLKKRRAKYITDIKLRVSDATALVYVSSSAIGKKSGKGKTSIRQLKYLSKAIKKDLRLNTEILIHRGEEQQKFEAGLCALLRDNFGEAVEDCYVSLPEEKFAEIWIDLTDFSLVNSESLKSKVIEYLELFDKKLRFIHWSGEKKEKPSNPIILRAVKTAAPAEVAEIQKIIEMKGLFVPSSEWLNGKLDLLRKNDMLLRQQDKTYVLTHKGLRLVPHGNFKSSSDIERALALGRRKW